MEQLLPGWAFEGEPFGAADALCLTTINSQAQPARQCPFLWRATEAIDRATEWNVFVGIWTGDYGARMLPAIFGGTELRRVFSI